MSNKLCLAKNSCISDFAMVTKITKKPRQRKKKNDEPVKSPSLPSRGTIKQALRMKCNTIIHYEAAKKQGISSSRTKRADLQQICFDKNRSTADYFIVCRVCFQSAADVKLEYPSRC